MRDEGGQKQRVGAGDVVKLARGPLLINAILLIILAAISLAANAMGNIPPYVAGALILAGIAGAIRDK